jgi:hypothetical protein
VVYNKKKKNYVREVKLCKHECREKILVRERMRDIIKNVGFFIDKYK